MGTFVARVKTIGHSGAMTLKLDFRLGREPNVNVFVHSDKSVAEDCCIWAFHNQKKMTLLPKLAFDENMCTEELKKRGDHDYKKWQPEFIYIQFCSNNGCDFTLHVNFMAEDQAA